MFFIAQERWYRTKICLTRHNLRTNLTKNFLKYPLKPHGSDTSVKKAKMNTTNSENNFHFIFENNITKTVSVSITSLLILFAGPLYYAIIWYERFGTNTKRTLINQVHSKNCRVNFANLFSGNLIFWMGIISKLESTRQVRIYLKIVAKIWTMFVKGLVL